MPNRFPSTCDHGRLRSNLRKLLSVRENLRAHASRSHYQDADFFVLRVDMECRLAARLVALLAQAKQFTSSRVYRPHVRHSPERIATGLSSLRWSSRLGLLTAVAVEIFMNNAG